MTSGLPDGDPLNPGSMRMRRNDAQFEMVKDAAGKSRFRLKAANKQIIGRPGVQFR